MNDLPQNRTPEDGLEKGLYRPRYRDPKTGETKESAIIWCRYYRNGQKVRVSTETDNLRQAIRFRNQCVGGKRPVTVALQRTSFEDLAELVVADYDLEGRRSTKRIKQALAHLRSFFEFDRARDIGTVKLNAYIKARRQDGAAPSTINRELSALRRSFTLAAAADPPQVDQVPSFPRLRENNARKGFFQRAELDAILEHLPGHLRAPILTAFFTGWRGPSEVLTRKRSHLSTQWVLRLEPGESKTKEAREFPVHKLPELRELLERQLENIRQLEVETGKVIPWLFPNPYGNRIRGNSRDYYGPWHAACRKAGLENPDRIPIPHDFRRSAARNLILAGVPRTAAKAVTGHKTDSVFDRYGIMDAEVTDWAVGKLADKFATEKSASNVVPLVGAKYGAK